MEVPKQIAEASECALSLISERKLGVQVFPRDTVISVNHIQRTYATIRQYLYG